jgi:hypothetical protein
MSKLDTIKWGIEHSKRAINRASAPSDFKIINNRVYIPTYINIDDGGEWLKYDRNQKKEYLCLRKTYERPKFAPTINLEEIPIKSSQEFSQLEFSIVDIQNVEKIEIKAVFTHTDGTETKTSIKHILSGHS